MKKLKEWIVMFVMCIVLLPTITYGMHIMEGFLPKEWAAFWTIVFLPFFGLGLRKMQKLFKQKPDTKMLIALVGAFVFVLSALKIPSVTGSCSHPTGVGLGAVLFGPLVMVVVGTIALLFQAILLAHGGITTLGANAFAMAIVGPFVSYAIYKLCTKCNCSKPISVFLASSIGCLATYAVTSLQLGLAFPDPQVGMAGSMIKFLGVFCITQIPIAIVEGILTVIVYDFIFKYHKEDADLFAEGVKIHD